MAGSDTVAALATAQGTGGIAIIRISGKEAKTALSRVFTFYAANPISDFIPRHMHYGIVTAPDGSTIDDVLAVYMPGPRSATGEDVAEIHCHGGIAISRAILDAVFAAGVRPAGPGEFTRRAFLNGRIDLTQAEAVAEAIAASTLEGARLARAKMEGALGLAVASLRTSLDHLRVLATVCVDFDEAAGDTLLETMAETTDETLVRIDSLLASYDRARLWREGASAVLAGQVNAGKSSLLNALLGRERAIVSAIPGTTRDYLEESILVHGIPMRVTDTAGLRTGTDSVEEEGIRRTEQLCEEADVLLLVVDATRGAGVAERAFAERHARQRLIIVLNKVDALAPPQNLPLMTHNGTGGDSTPPADEPLHQYAQAVHHTRNTLFPDGTGTVLPVSAKLGYGLQALCDALGEALRQDLPAAGSDAAPNARQYRLLCLAREELVALKADMEAGMPVDILCVRLDAAVMHCDEITGVSSNDAILGTIFSSFCIGK